MTKRQTRRTLLALAIGWLAATSAAFAGHPVATDVVPAGSAGYVHFYPQEIRNAPAMNLFHRLLEHVQDEASTLSLTRLGLDLTTLEQATVVFAPVEQLVNAQGEPPCVVVATFAKPFRAEDLRRSIGSEWRDVGSHKRIVFENPASDTSVHVFSETTLVLGPSSGVQWWMNTPGEEGRTSLASLLHNSFGHGHVLLGFDFRSVPAEMKKAVPPMSATFARANFASIDLYFADHIQAAAYLHFGQEQTAELAGRELTNLLQQGAGLLAMTEAQFSSLVKDKDTNVEAALGGLLTLAIAREGGRTLRNIEVNVDGVDLMAKVTIDQNLVSMMGLCLASIQAVGQKAEARFENISDQLGP